MKVAITGGTGFVGSHLAELLTAQGHEVVLISRRLGSDVSDLEVLTAAFEGCDGVVHCAGINRETGDQAYQKVHIEGTRNVVEAAKHARIRKVVMMSFLRARPQCESAYHESKWDAEQIVRDSGLDFTVLKAGVIYGSGDHMLDHLSRAFYTFPLFALVGMRDQRVRPAAVQDVARILAAALTDPRLVRKTVPITGPEEIPLSQAVRRIAAVVGKRPFFFRMPVWFHYGLAWVCEQTMKIPMVSIAQVRILSEGLVEPSPPCDLLPEDLAPKIPFGREQIRRGLPAAGRITLSDLRCPVPCKI